MVQDISVRDCTLEKGFPPIIARNRIGSIVSRNNEYCKRTGAKIINGALPGGAGILVCAIGRAKEIAVSESRKITRVV